MQTNFLNYTKLTDYGAARACMLGIGVFTGVDYGEARACMLGIGVFTGVDYGEARACIYAGYRCIHWGRLWGS